jgi:hypothetical protein
MTLIAVILYVFLTWRIAVATKNATESAAKTTESDVKTTKAQIAVTLVDELYSDATVQDMLHKIYTHDIDFKNENGTPFLTSADDPEKQNLEPKLAMMLNKFQILGHLLDLGVLQKRDIIGLRYEIIEIGRDKAIREYFDFLNKPYQKSTGIDHDHFKNFKSLYMAFEDASHKKEFEQYLFTYAPGKSPED